MKESDINLTISLLEVLLEEAENDVFTVNFNDGDAIVKSLEYGEKATITDALSVLKDLVCL